MRKGVATERGYTLFFLGIQAGCFRALKARVNEHYSMDSRRHEYRIP